MKSKNYSAITLLIFIFGVIIVAFALFFIQDLFSDRTGTYVFICISTMLIYVAAFLPLLMNFCGNISQIITSGTIYYKGMSVFGLMSAVDIFLAIKYIPLTAAIVIELVAVFVFLIYIFMTCVVSDTIGGIDGAEEGNRVAIIEMRKKAQQLSIMAGKVDNKDVKAAVERINENLRYLSPSGQQEAHKLEGLMSAALDSILSDSYFSLGNAYTTETLEAKFDEFDRLFNQRKNIYFER